MRPEKVNTRRRGSRRDNPQQGVQEERGKSWEPVCGVSWSGSRTRGGGGGFGGAHVAQERRAGQVGRCLGGLLLRQALTTRASTLWVVLRVTFSFRYVQNPLSASRLA